MIGSSSTEQTNKVICWDKQKSLLFARLFHEKVRRSERRGGEAEESLNVCSHDPDF